MDFGVTEAPPQRIGISLPSFKMGTDSKPKGMPALGGLGKLGQNQQLTDAQR